MNNVRALLGDKNVDIPFAVQGHLVSRVNRANFSLKLLKYLLIAILIIATVDNIILLSMSQKGLYDVVADIVVIVLLFLLLMCMKLSQGDTIIVGNEELVEANWLYVKRIKWNDIKHVIVYSSYEDNMSKVFTNLPHTLMKVVGNGCVIGIKSSYSDISILRKSVINRVGSKVVNRTVDFEGLIVFILALAMGVLVAIYAQGHK
jgi:hypothetical protein